jgi:nitrite reductase/ring-hydroxylating ferredoxin subunit
MSDDAIPILAFPPIVINLNLPDYNTLKSDGGYKVLSSSVGGVQGIIIYRVNASTYMAYERNCSYQPNNACATVEVDPSGLFMKDPCCGSSFSLTTGQPTGSPAWRPLRQYQTSLVNSDLSITDDIVE